MLGGVAVATYVFRLCELSHCLIKLADWDFLHWALYNEYNYFAGLTIFMEDNNVIYTSLVVGWGGGGLLCIKQIHERCVYGVDTW